MPPVYTACTAGLVGVMISLMTEQPQTYLPPGKVERIFVVVDDVVVVVDQKQTMGLGRSFS